MRYLIVNADDFGASHGINRGILEAHRAGILTSTSLMVYGPWSVEAAAQSRFVPELSVGLHAHLEGSALEDARDCRAELLRQLRRFEELVGRLPSHCDSHHDVHRDPRLLDAFLHLAARCGCPVRRYSPARCVSGFYGQWSGESHPEQIGVESFVRLLDTEVGDGVTEICCHPGYVDDGLRSSYASERELELRTLCHPSVRTALGERAIRLISFDELRWLRAQGCA
jgi:predicted glycoside hydrolase/deacetylase ChbG (UPF0249 family)